MSAASVGQHGARVALPDEPQLDDVVTLFAMSLNVLLDDLSSRITAAERMRETYRAMFEGSPRPMCVVDPTTFAFVAVNEATVRHYGYTRDELSTMRSPDLWFPEDLDANLEITKRPLPLRDVLMRHRKKDGMACWVEVHVNAVAFEGRSSRLVLIDDVTRRVAAEQARKAAEARFARLAGSGLIGILVNNLDGRVLEVNGALV
ncbi:MAG: PAS domain S-box protein, partial [Polyangiaceae bacterium]